MLNNLLRSFGEDVVFALRVSEGGWRGASVFNVSAEWKGSYLRSEVEVLCRLATTSDASFTTIQPQLRGTAIPLISVARFEET